MGIHSLSRFSSKFFTAIVIVILTITVFPVQVAQAADTGFNSPTTCASGGGQWANPTNATASDNIYTTSNANNEVLVCTFNLPAIPAGNTIVGIEVSIEGLASGTREADVDLTWNNGTYTGGDPTTTFGAAETTFTLGGTTDTWGRTWAVGDFTAANFRVRLTSNNGSNTISLDQIRVRVTYFAPLTITSSAGAGGTINPNGATSVTYGNNQTYTIAPSVNNIVAGVSIDGGASVGRLNSYTFTNVTANHTIAATFEGGWSQASSNFFSPWTGEGNAYVSDNSYAVGNGDDDEVEFGNFGLSVPAGNQIDGIEVAIEANASADREVDIDLSWNNGATHTGPFDPITALPNGGTDATYIFGGPTNTWGRSWSPTEISNGNFTVRLNTDNNSGNFNLDQIQVKIYYSPDVTAPSIVSFTREDPNQQITDDNTLTFRVIFSEGVQNVSAGDFTINSTTTATITGVTQVASNIYDIDIAGGNLATFNGTVNLNLSGTQNITDFANLALPAGEPATDETYIVDNTDPVILSITRLTPSTNPTNANSLTFRVIFNEDVDNVDQDDFDVTGTSTNISNVTQVNGFTYDVTISGGGNLATYNGVVGLILDITGGGTQDIEDEAGNNLPDTQPTTLETYTLDNIAPTVTVIQAIGQADPTSDSPINFTVTFSEAMATNFVTGDVTFTGTAGGPLVGTVTGGPTIFNVAVTGMSTGGTITASIGANVATDLAGNNNTASPAIGDRTVTFIPKVNTTTTVNCVPNPVEAFSGTTCTATVTRVSGANTPSGTVTWGTSDSGSFTPLNTCTLSGSGASTTCSVTYTPSAVGSGSHLITASYAGDGNFNPSSGNQNVTVNKATPIITWNNPADITYGTALGASELNATASTAGTFTYTPASGTVLNAGASQNLHVDFVPTDTTNYNNASADVTINVNQAPSTTVITCPASEVYTGAAIEPCTVSVTGVGGLNLTPTPVYSNNVNVGTANVSYTYAGDASHTGSSDATTFNITQAPSIVTVTCPASVSYTGAAITPCTAEATSAGMSPVDVTASLVYSNNTNAGLATANASWAGDANHSGNTGTDTFSISTITLTVTADNHTINYGDADPTFTFTYSGFIGTEDATDLTTEPTCTVSGVHTNVGTYSIVCSGGVDDNYSFNYINGTLTVQGITLTVTADDQLISVGDPDPTFTFTYSGFVGIDDATVLTTEPTCTVTVAHSTVGSYPITCSGGVDDNYSFNYVDGSLNVNGAPYIVTNGVRTNAGVLTDFQILSVNINQIQVEFNEDVYDDPTNTTNYTDDATNPANYLLVRDNQNDGIQTTSCSTGIVTPSDIGINVDTATYNNGGGSGPFVSTLTINNGLPLSNGQYRLIVCGTTSIGDALNPNLSLAGDGANSGTDFLINFRVAISRGNPGGGNAGNTGSNSGGVGSFLIPVTGFTPEKITELPVQPASLKYAPSNGLEIEIPSLGVRIPIVGVKLDKTGWDVKWLGNNAGYLEGSAYPTVAGNSVITGHVTDANGKPGVFAYLNELKKNDLVIIHINGQQYIYQIREDFLTSDKNIKTVFKHEEYQWITLVTCENYNEKLDRFTHRRVVRAVLISVIPEE